MEEPLNIGRRTVMRDFEQDRHSSAVLAEAFQRLSRAGSTCEAAEGTVQVGPERAIKRLRLQEAGR